MTLNEIITEVKDWLNMPDTSPTSNGTPSNTSITRFINMELRALYRDIVTIQKRRFGTSAALTYTSQSEAVALPAGAVGNGIIKVEARIVSTDRGRMLEESVIEEFRNWTDIGTPMVYAVLGSNIQLRPKPSTDQLLTIWYAPSNTALSSGSDSPSWLHVDFHSLVGLGAALRLRRKLDDPASALKEQYDDDRALMEQHYYGLINDNHLHENDSAEEYNHG